MAENKVQHETEGAESKGVMSRRKLLASLGLAGVALASGGVLGKVVEAAAMETESANNGTKVPELMNADFVVPVTLQELRANTNPDANTVYYVTDAWKEGSFVYDPNDAASADNAGTVVVSSSGARFKRVVQGNIHVGWFGAAADGSTDDTAAVQAAFTYAASVGGGTIEFRAGKDYRITATIEVGTRTNVRGNNAVIVFAGSNSAMFHTIPKSTDIYFEKLLCVDTTQTNTAFFLEGAGAGNINNYTRYVDLFAVQLVNFKLGVRALYARTWKMDRCNFYVGSGVLIENKSVEINITDCIIYGMADAPADTYAIKCDTTTGEYPEGVMVNGCTLDNFGRTVWLRNVFVFQLTNSYVASNGQSGRYAFYADKGVGSHCQDITVNNVEFNGNGVCFRPGTPHPVLYKGVFSNCLFENVRDANIELGRFAYDLSFDNLRFECFPDNNPIVAVCEDVNQRIQFNHLITNDFPVFGILVKGKYSTVAIRGFDYNGRGSALYLEQSTFVESVRSVYADTQTRDYLHKYAQLPAGSYGPGQAIGGTTMNIADGQKGTITINGTVKFTGAAPLLKVVVPDNRLIVPAGAGWSALAVKPGASGQYVSVTIPFQVAANNGDYSPFGINNGYFGLEVDPASAGSVEFESDAYISIRLED